MVVTEGKTTIRQVNKAQGMLPRDKLLGYVVNRQRMEKGSKYGYYYNY